MIIGLQRSVRTVGRLRIGEQAPTRTGKLAPKKLSTFRLSSPQRPPIDLAAQLYGGQVRPMDNDRSDDRWQVVTEADSIPVVIPPTHHLSQHYELWDAAGCQRRCDGQEAIVMDGRPTGGVACACDPERRECSITTRLSVILPELEALGVWRLDSKGWYAATELAGAADLCAAATGRGVAIPARLDLEQRTRRSRDRDGKPRTFKFAVPVLSVDVSIPQARAILGGVDTSTGELRDAPPRQMEAAPQRQLTPRAAPQLDAGPLVELPPPPPADIPLPRTHEQYQAAQVDPAPEPAPDPDIDPGDLPVKPHQRRKIFALANGLKMSDDDRHKLYSDMTGGAKTSITDLTADEADEVVAQLEARTKAPK